MKKVLDKAIQTYGKDMQQSVAIEEMSELTKEICKMKRGEGNRLHLAEEIADVEIMVEQLKMIYEVEGLVNVYKHNKIARLKDRLKDKEYLNKCIEQEGDE